MTLQQKIRRAELKRKSYRIERERHLRKMRALGLSDLHIKVSDVDGIRTIKIRRRGKARFRPEARPTDNDVHVAVRHYATFYQPAIQMQDEVDCRGCTWLVFEIRHQTSSL